MTQIQESPAWAYRIAHRHGDATEVYTFNTLHELRQYELFLAMNAIPIVSIMQARLFVTSEGKIVERWRSFSGEISTSS